MSKSFRTQPPRVSAIQKKCRNKDDDFLADIKVIKPTYGDVHPLNKPTIRNILKSIPFEYVNGLKRIELRSRVGKFQSLDWGQVLGYYLSDDKVIWLYSFPLEGTISGATVSKVKNTFNAFERFGGLEDKPEVTEYFDKVYFKWNSEISLRLWFSHLLFHEIGHHYVEQYQIRNGRIKDRNKEELVADLHMDRLMTEDIFKLLM